MMIFTGIFPCPHNIIPPPSQYALPFHFTQNTGQCEGAHSCTFKFLSRLQAVKMMYFGITPTLLFSEIKKIAGKTDLGEYR